jgi:hypothetical protein
MLKFCEIGFKDEAHENATRRWVAFIVEVENRSNQLFRYA